MTLTFKHLLKHVDLRKTPSLEFGIIMIFSYLPYVLSEGLKLSGKFILLIDGNPINITRVLTKGGSDKLSKLKRYTNIPPSRLANAFERFLYSTICRDVVSPFFNGIPVYFALKKFDPTLC